MTRFGLFALLIEAAACSHEIKCRARRSTNLLRPSGRNEAIGVIDARCGIARGRHHAEDNIDRRDFFRCKAGPGAPIQRRIVADHVKEHLDVLDHPDCSNSVISLAHRLESVHEPVSQTLLDNARTWTLGLHVSEDRSRGAVPQVTQQLTFAAA